ncbi:hypothetical protein DVH24_015833 [Malus domestica]|uniref:DUF7788 domain-containing protein n=1 Tax=Malus domestica TaxID=3750 RepID=A0A498JF67_MALDO|nr:hypothetical protein DVH24_015833 [Malus domestica]
MIEDEHYVYRVRDRLRKEVLVPLRKALNLLKAGKTKIAADALLHHQIISSLEERGIGGKVAELQWKRMVDDMFEYGIMRNRLAICDVSRSMCGIPMDVSVALGISMSELSDEHWKGKVITFSQSPQLHLIQGDDLQSKCEFVRCMNCWGLKRLHYFVDTKLQLNMNWGMNTDFQKVFDLLLEVAVNGNMRPEHMIKRIFVFSDMEFDEVSENNWETDYEAIRRKFKEKGSTPVFETQPGVALVCGFSKNMLKLFMNNDGEVRPDHVMEVAISGKKYRSLVVVD